MNKKDMDIQIEYAKNNDVNYWNEYYFEANLKLDPSLFAKFILDKMELNKRIIELGCGNGRDSLYFASKGFDVIAIDSSENAIKLARSFCKDDYKLTFAIGNFINNQILTHNKYDYVYSRFTLHSINERDESILIKNCFKSLNNNGMFFIETRTINDDIFGKGIEVERNAYFYNNHYRRFIIKAELEEKLINMGFKIEFSQESKNFAPFDNSDPIILRVIGKKEQ